MRRQKPKVPKNTPLELVIFSAVQHLPDLPLLDWRPGRNPPLAGIESSVATVQTGCWDSNPTTLLAQRLGLVPCRW
jgi:hypothetical protein